MVLKNIVQEFISDLCEKRSRFCETLKPGVVGEEEGHGPSSSKSFTKSAH